MYTTSNDLPVLHYNKDLKAEIVCKTSPAPLAKVHQVEWRKVMAGDPVEINPSVGTGFKVMTVDEWAERWKPNPDFPSCLGCSSNNTKEHYFTQTWCRGRKWWQAESLCLDCHCFSWREYHDPDFKTPEQWEKEEWTARTKAEMFAMFQAKQRQAQAAAGGSAAGQLAAPGERQLLQAA